jgi:hypothetical protein
MLIHLYAVSSKPAAIKLDPESGANGHLNGHANGHLNGHVRGVAEEFELDGLMSGDEDDADEEERLVKTER